MESGPSVRRRHLLISLFVLVWIGLFHYETLRLNYLSPLAGRELPKLKFLYPAAGWIMFFHVDRGYGFAEVYGLAPGQPPVAIDPHAILRPRAVGYDNIRRNVLVGVLAPHHAPRFCGYLASTFPQYPAFAVVQGYYPDVVDHPDEVRRGVAYRCPP